MKRVLLACICVFQLAMSAPSQALQNSWSLVGVISSDHGQSIAVVKHKPSNRIHTLREGEVLSTSDLQFIRVLSHDSIKAIWQGKPITVTNDGGSQYDLVDHKLELYGVKKKS